MVFGKKKKKNNNTGGGGTCGHHWREKIMGRDGKWIFVDRWCGLPKGHSGFHH